MFKKRRVSDRAGSGATIRQDFSRNRTMPNKIYQQDLSKAEAESKRLRRHRTSIFWRRAGRLLIVVIITFTLLYILSLNFISRPLVELDGSDIAREVDIKIYERTIASYLDKYPLSRVKFLINYSELLSFVQSVNPEVIDITSAKHRSVGQADFMIAFRKPIASWLINGEQNYVDSSGVVFKLNYYKKPAIQVKDEATSDHGGSIMISNYFLGFIGRVVSVYQQQGYEVLEMVIPQGKVRQVNVRLKDVGPVIKVSSDRSVGEQVEDSINAIEYFKSNGWAPSYVDVRVSRRAAWQ